MKTDIYYRIYLRGMLKNPKQNGKLRTLRSMAKYLSIDPGLLSKIIAGKRKLSIQNGIRIIDKYNISIDDADKIIISIMQEHIEEMIVGIDSQKIKPFIDQISSVLPTFNKGIIS